MNMKIYKGMKNKKKKGFTLIELIAVIAILGILVAIIAPRMTGYTDSAKVAKTKANVKTLVTVIEVYNSTAVDYAVDDGTTVSNMKSGSDGSHNLDGDKNAIQSLKDTADAVEEDEAILGSTDYSDLKAVLATTGSATYVDIKDLMD